ncbi:MAG: TldD/PmbA family protein [Longimicrobiales bacterium]|nr:TldD/PmbA family protein [Longimicrobiales bacterium]
MQYENLSQELVDRCLSRGADSAEVLIEEGRQLSIEVRNGEMETIQESSSHGAGFRVFREGKMGFAHSNDLSGASLDQAIESAVNFAQHMTADEHNILPGDPGVTPVDGLFDPDMAGVSMDDKIAMITELERLAMADSRITVSNGSGYGEGEGSVYLANSNGLAKSYRSGACNFGVSVVAEKGDQKSSGGEYCSRRFFSELLSPEEIAEKAARSAYEMLDPRMVRTQRAPVIFHPDVARSLLGGLLGAINGERVLQGASFLADKVGEKIASELITVVDDGTRPKGLASSPFDGEGVPTQRRTIIDGGVLQGFMYNTMVASRAGVQSTGNASRGGFSSLPGIGPHAFYVEAGDTDPEEIIRSTPNGLYLKSVTGYGINPVSGGFSGGAQGFWIQNGRLAFPVMGLTIAASADEMLNGIDVLGSDLDLNQTMTAPTFRIREMQIGGM